MVLCLQTRVHNLFAGGDWREIWYLSNKSGYKRGNKWNLVSEYVPSTFIMHKCVPVSFINPLTQTTLLLCNKKRILVNLKWRQATGMSERVSELLLRENKIILSK